jgi:hypothetical protein
MKDSMFVFEKGTPFSIRPPQLLPQAAEGFFISPGPER